MSWPAARTFPDISSAPLTDRTIIVTGEQNGRSIGFNIAFHGTFDEHFEVPVLIQTRKIETAR